MLFNRKIVEEVHENEITKQKIASIIAADSDLRQFTPDYDRLSQSRSRLLFVPDDMAQLQRNHHLVTDGSLSGFYPLGYGYTSRRFTFIKKELGLNSFPIALSLSQETQDNLPLHMSVEHRIRGEIYAVRPRQFITLDTHRQNGVQFKRETMNINIGYRKLLKKKTKAEYRMQKEEMITIPMFMYVGREEYWKDQLEADFFNFKPVGVVQEDRLWLREYYQYSRVR